MLKMAMKAAAVPTIAYIAIVVVSDDSLLNGTLQAYHISIKAFGL
jgi:hypothetical protein